MSDERLPLVSVITPCFRQGHFLGEAIESVLGQTHPRVEMVVVNDGSDDDTDTVARGYGEKIKYVRQENAGLPAARNAGVRVAVGTYLLFLDADDMLLPSAIAWLVEAVGGEANALGIMGFRLFTSDPDVGEDIIPPAVPLLPTVVRDNPAPPLAYLAPAQVVRAVGGFSTDLTYGCEDWDLWMRLSFRGVSPRFVARVGGLYRRHAGTMSTKGIVMDWARTEVLDRACKTILRRPDLAQWRIEVPSIRSRIVKLSLRVGWRAARCGRLALSGKALLRSIEYGALSDRAQVTRSAARKLLAWRQSFGQP